jgi:AcrR family transcriptional regulator
MSLERPYHHGRLRAALIAAGLEVVETQGPDALSLRDLARSLGVSATAPYRHFEDRRALLTAIAAEGFKDLTRRYEAILAEDLSPRAKARAINRVFLELGGQRPGLFELMFESDLLSGEAAPEELRDVASGPFPLLLSMVKQVRPDMDAKTAKARVIAGWSTLWGYIVIKRQGLLTPLMIEPLTEEELTEAVLDYVSGGRD